MADGQLLPLATIKLWMLMLLPAPRRRCCCRRQSSSLGQSGSFLKKNSQILRAVNEYEQRCVLPDNPGRLPQLAGRVYGACS